MKTKKILKRLAILLGVFLILLIGALAAIPYFFKDELLTAVQDQANENLNATVAFSDVSLSLFRHFPDVSVRLDELVVTGKAPFEGVDLVRTESIDLTFDLLSVIRAEEPLKIQEVQLNEPRVEVIVLEDGTANYDIALPADSTGTAADPTDDSVSELEVALRQYGISDGFLIYDDRAGDILVRAEGLNHNGEGDFTLSVYNLSTTTDIESLTVESGGIGYLQQSKINLLADLNADLETMKFTLKENELTVNALALKADGFVAMPNEEDIELDLEFMAPGSDFRELLSLVPNAFIEGYEDVQVDGSFSLAGNVKGIYNSSTYPSFNLLTEIDQGRFQYPDLPVGMSNIQTKIRVNSPGSDLDQMTVKIPQFAFLLGGNPMEGYFNLATPLSDPDIDTRIRGDLKLDDLAKAFPMEGVRRMAGLIQADVTLKSRLSAIEREDYERVDAAGSVQLNQIVYEAEDMPPVLIRTAVAQFTPQRVELDRFESELGRSDLRINGTVDNPLAYFSSTRTMEGNLTLRSNYFNADEWMTSEASRSEATPAAYGTAAPQSEETTEIFNRFDFALDAAIQQLDYAPYTIRDIVAVGQLQPNRLQIERSALVIDQSDLAATGTITGIWDYLFEEGTLGGDLMLESRLLDLNPFMATDEAVETAEVDETSEAYEPIVVPDNIEMDIRARIGRCLYTDLDLSDLEGHVIVADQEATIEYCNARGLGGDIAISGGYGTQDPTNPTFNLKYDLQNLEFQQAFQAFNTFEQLAPIGKYIQGHFNSTLIMDGVLGSDFMPKWSSLNADGFLQTLDAVVRNFPPLEAVGNKLNIGYFQNLPLQDTKNWFEVVDGAVILKDFDYSYQDIDMVIGGRHGINQDMDYQIVSKIPRELLEKNAAGAGLNALQQEAGKLGLNLQQSEYVNVQFNLGGKLTDPKVSMKLLGAGGEAGIVEGAKEKAREELDAQAERLEQEAEKQIEAAKKEAEKTAKEVRDSLEKVAREEAAKKRKELEEQARKELEKKKQKTAEEIQKKLEDFNPFKQKKKKGGGN